MNLSTRSKLSLCQFLGLFERDHISLLLEKYGFRTFHPERSAGAQITDAIQYASDKQIGEVLDEVLRTLRTMRSEIDRKFRFDQRWKDLLLCLELDGYRLDENGDETDSFVSIEPKIEGVQAVEDDLTLEIGQSELPDADEIVKVIEKSADAFRKEDYNACLNSSRVALQSLARSIAEKRQSHQPGNFDPSRWGEVVAYLRKSRFISEQQEAGLTGVFRFVSPGSHTPVLGGSEQEFARLGRSLALGFCYFLIKQFNGQTQISE